MTRNANSGLPAIKPRVQLPPPHQFTAARPECVDGVVFMGGGAKMKGNLAKLDIPSLLIRGSRDPLTPERVRAC